MNGIILALFGAFALASSATIKSNVQNICAANGSNGILVEHEDCAKFYMCSEGNPVTFSCPTQPTLFYNDQIKACDWPENVECGDRVVKKDQDEDNVNDKEIEIPEPETIYNDPSKATEVCAAEGSDGTLVAHEECTKFYICSEGFPVSCDCGNNPVLYYHPQLKACEWSENVVCGTRVEPGQREEKEEKEELVVVENDSIVDTNSSYEENAVGVCAGDKSDGILLPHGDCDKFYKCSEGKPYPIQCPTNPPLLYNPGHQYCDWANQVDCGDRK